MPEHERLELVYRTYFPIIRAKCRRMLADPAEAEDVAQETFVRLWNSDTSRADARTVAAWIYRTATRMAIDRLRHRAVASRVAGSLRPVSPHPADAIEAGDTLRVLARAVDERTLSAAILHRVDGLTHQQVGELLDVSERSVRRMLAAFDEAAVRQRAAQESP